MTEEDNEPDPDVLQVEPAESGSAMVQTEGASDFAPPDWTEETKGELGQFNWTSAAEDLSDVRGQAAMRFLKEAFRSLEAGRADAIRMLAETRQELQSAQEESAAAKTEAAVLRERLNAQREVRPLRQGLITLGGLLLGAAGTQLVAGVTVAWAAVLAAAIVLMLVGWFGGSGKEK